MSRQADITPIEEFDEDSVFNRLFSPKKLNSRNTPITRLEHIFADAPTPAEVIDVKDFIPVYVG